MLGTIWVGKANETSFVLNVPQNSPIPHATYYPYYILEEMIIFWIAYAGFEFFYFSPDWVPFYRVRKWAHRIANAFMGFYIIYISVFVPLVTFDVIYVRDPTWQFYIFYEIIVLIAILEADFILWVWKTQKMGLIRRLIWAIRKWRNRLPEWNESRLSSTQPAE